MNLLNYSELRLHLHQIIRCNLNKNISIINDIDQSFRAKNITKCMAKKINKITRANQIGDRSRQSGITNTFLCK